MKTLFVTVLAASLFGWEPTARAAATQCSIQQADFLTSLKSCQSLQISVLLKDKTALSGTLSFVGQDYIWLISSNSAVLLIPTANIQYVISE